MDQMELLGKSRVRVEHERAVEASLPMIEWCPLFWKVRGVERITADAAMDNMDFRIKEHGMFTPRRKLEMDAFVGFGASETMMTGISSGIIQAAVTVCDGAGTVITDNPTLVQGMGGWISGLVETDPIPEVLDGIAARGGHVLSPEDAKIDQVEGAYWASERFEKFAVTVADLASAEALRAIEDERGARIMIIGVHLTGIDRSDASRLLDIADIVTSCASKEIRDLVKPLIQVGTAIPLFGLTKWGKEILVERAKEVTSPILINTMQLPVLPQEKQPRPLV
ncbi:MAG: DUF2099 family protein [Methanotrichaceae archaeon]|nr:DUF2099 family protein [Methanotrichaceae archaeon]